MVFVAAPVGSALADDARNDISIRADWQSGDEVTLIHERIGVTQKNHDPPTKTHTRTPTTIRVLERLDDGYRLRVEYGPTTFVPPDPEMEKSIVDVPQPPMLIRLSNDGEITSLENWEAVRDASIDIVRKGLVESGVPPEEIEPALKKSSAMVATHEHATKMLTGDIAMYFLPIGVEVIAGEPFDSSGSVMNPFGSEPFPTKNRLTAAAVPGTDRRFRITLDTRFDEEAAARIMRESLEALAEKDVASAPPFTKFSVEEHAEFVFDEGRGWVVKGEHARTSMIDGTHKIDKWVWTLDRLATSLPPKGD